MVQIIEAPQDARPEILDLLQSARLPTEDLPDTLSDFFMAVDRQKPVAVIGLERYGTLGLLRSLVVHAEYRN